MRRWPNSDSGSGATVTGPTFTTTDDPMGRPNGMNDQTVQTSGAHKVKDRGSALPH